uniref:Uncharacterized protein n=1 Tax=Zea mays TaxID=4577 RepID=B6U6G2_MAIZE|nr:hypothetical protein [Zea mays]
MGLAGGIVRRVFSKSPCSSAGSRGHSVRAFSYIACSSLVGVSLCPRRGTSFVLVQYVVVLL